MPGRAVSTFATYLIIGPTCFFLGILFILLPYDYHVLWSTPPMIGGKFDRGPYFDLQETNLKILHSSPPLIARILNLAITTGLLGFMIKLYKPKEANLLFDGASLALYLCGVIVYIANIVKGLRAAGSGDWGADVVAAAKREGITGDGSEDILSREDSLRVLAASNTILALVLVGVLVLQAGQWYAQNEERKEIEGFKRARAAAAASSEKGTTSSAKGKKKNA